MSAPCSPGGSRVSHYAQPFTRKRTYPLKLHFAYSTVNNFTLLQMISSMIPLYPALRYICHRIKRKYTYCYLPISGQNDLLRHRKHPGVDLLRHCHPLCMGLFRMPRQNWLTPRLAVAGTAGNMQFPFNLIFLCLSFYH